MLMNNYDVSFTPFKDQKAGTSGLRKPVSQFQQQHYTESFLQAVFNCQGGVAGKKIVVGGDGRYFSAAAVQIIIKMAVAQRAACVIVGENALLSTPAASHIIRHYKADFAIILSASHNPGGENGDFGIKINLSEGQPAPENKMQDFYRESLTNTKYQISDVAVPELRRGKHLLEATTIDIISSSADYVQLMEQLFDFEIISDYLKQHDILFDAMHAVTGAYANALFVEKLGLASDCLLHTTPLEDFGGHHPDPSPTNNKLLIDLMNKNPRVVLAAASDGDGDRNLILARNHFINPCDSLAIIADCHRCVPCLANLRGIGRTMPTSRAVDTVAKAHDFTCFETPTGWKYFANLLDADLIQLCGEESFGTSGNHIREKDGLWAILCWLNILASSGKTPDELLQEHWKRYGKHHFNRFDFSNLDAQQATMMLKNFEGNLKTMIGTSVHGLTITSGEQFNYIDPTNDDLSSSQGLQIKFGRQARIICRLSGTDTRGATLRIYCEYWQQDISKRPALTAPTATLVGMAQGMMNLEYYCQRIQPDNII